MREFPMYSQYVNSPKFTKLVQEFSNALLFQETDFAKHYLSIKDASTAGLDNWGVILNQKREVLSGEAYDGVFGFFNGDIITDETSYPQNFYYSNFFNDNYAPTKILDDDEYRALLQLLFDKYTTDNSIKSLNEIMQTYSELRNASGRGIVHTTYDMKIIYEFDYPLEPYEYYLFRKKDILPRAAGINVEINFIF